MSLLQPHRYPTHPSNLSSMASNRSLRSGVSRMAFCLLWLTAICQPPLWADGDGIFILPDGVPWIGIEDADLLAGLPPTASRVLSTTPAGRGVLFDLSGTGNTYQTTPEFFDRGSDSFHFEAELKDTGLWSTAFLVAGMKGDARFFLPLDGPGELGSVPLTNGHDIHLNDVHPIHGPYDLLFDLEPDAVAYLTLSDEDGDLGDGPKGGTLGGGIDTGDGFQHADARLTIAMAEDYLGQILARVILLKGDSGPELAGDVKVGGSFVRIGQAAIRSGSAWELQWWGATASGSQDGGGMLLIDGTAVAKLGGLDNPELRRPVRWYFGAISNHGVEGALQLDDLKGEAALRVPRIHPLFADNFQTNAPVWSDSDCGLSSPPAGSGGILTVPLPALSNCFLSRSLDQAESRLKARFTIDMTHAGIGANGEISLFRGRGSDGGPPPIDVRLRRGGNSDLELTVRGLTGNDVSQSLDWASIAESGEVEIEVHWWAASSPFHANGGLRLIINGAYPQALNLELDNHGAEVTELALGAMGVGGGHFGTISYGAFEVWR